MSLPRKPKADEVAIRNPETGGVTIVPEKSFDNYWKGRGWVLYGELSLSERLAADGYENATQAVEVEGEDEVAPEVLAAAIDEGYLPSEPDD